MLTIEPGVYFIATLLDELRRQPAGRNVNWAKVDELMKFGGIRIEDNAVVTASGADNLTRTAFANASA